MALRWFTAGESHGPQLTVLIEGLPAGLEIAPDDLRKDLARRQETTVTEAALVETIRGLLQ